MQSSVLSIDHYILKMFINYKISEVGGNQWSCAYLTCNAKDTLYHVVSNTDLIIYVKINIYIISMQT